MKRMTFLLLVAACAAKAPPDPNNADAGGDGALVTTQTVSGKVIDYFGAVAMQDTAIASDGIDPPVMMTSAMDGAYSVDIAVGSKLYFTATKTMYRPTRNAPIAVVDMPITQDVYA